MKKDVKRLLGRFKKEMLIRFSNKIVNITIFGSQARGDAKEDSDVDVLIVTKHNDWHLADKIGEVAYNLLLETGTYISTKVISRQHYGYLRQIKAPFLTHILKEGISLWLKSVEKEYGIILREEKEDREAGDYDVFEVIEMDRAQQRVIDAQQFVNRMEDFIRQEVKKS